MKLFVILFALLVSSCSGKGKKIKKQIKEIWSDLNKLEDAMSTVEDALDTCENKLNAVEGKLVGLEKIWHLGMNINPADGHVFGYTVGWATGDNIGSENTALSKDYLSGGVWDEPANYIAIVRHQLGVVDAVKVFKFKHWGASLSVRFGLKNMDPGRQIVTKGGPIQTSIAEDAKNIKDDPIFSVDGDLAFNWAYDNNGCRIALTGGHLSGATVNDDNTHGLGMDFYGNPLKNVPFAFESSSLDASVIQDCSLLENCEDIRVQGTDHGLASALKSGPVYGNYAIYVSLHADSFPKPGYQLSHEIKI